MPVRFATTQRNVATLSRIRYPDVYPNLYIACEPFAPEELRVWVRFVHDVDTDYSWAGLIVPREPLGSIRVGDPLTHAILAVLDAKARQAIESDGFVCCSCLEPKEMASLSGTNFSSYYCTGCYDFSPVVKRLVDVAKEPGYYD